LEVRNRSDGHPPFTEREREIHLNGIGGVKFCERLGLIDESKPFFFSENAEREASKPIVIPNEVRDLTIEAEDTQSRIACSTAEREILRSAQDDISVERWALSVERWAFRADESYTRP
jgi:hypothetical protein